MSQTLQVKGPQRGNGRVSFHTEYMRTRSGTSRAFWVVIGLDRLREIDLTPKSNPRQNEPVLPQQNGQDVWGHAATIRTPKRLPEPRGNIIDAETSEDETYNEADEADEDNHSESNGSEGSETDGLNLKEPNGFGKGARSPSSAFTDADESEIEILEVRPVDRAGSFSESDLSSLDEELNHALSSTVTVPTQVDHTYRSLPVKPESIYKIIPSICNPVITRTSPVPPGYRNIPPNLVSTIQRELNLFFDTGNDDDLEVVGRVIFSLKDPYSATKIRLPVKATTCRHFECFDFENFCLFHKLPLGVKGSLKKGLVLKSHDSRRLEQLFIKQQQQIARGSLLFKAPGLIYPQFSEHGQMFFTEIFNRTAPLYKCPLCDEKFGLKQLYISDIFNFFVKTTPLHTTRIELVESDRYKILEDEVAETQSDAAECVVLSGDDSESDAEPNRSTSLDDFNDGLDDVLLTIRQGDGLWGDPVMLD